MADGIRFKKIFLSGFVIFTLGSFFYGLLSDLFSSFFALIGSRALQAMVVRRLQRLYWLPPLEKYAGSDRTGALLIFTGLAALLFAVS